jgi:transcriptional regulator with XRE-family HTH domain
MKAIELGSFLRSRRERLDPSSVGLPAAGKRRTAGLRREEVAVLAGVGVSWLTRLEQGKANRVSAEVLDGLAGALRLSRTERRHLFALAEVHLAPTTPSIELEASDRRLLDGLNPHPAYLLDHHWNLAGWNASEAELFPMLDHAGEHPNLLRLFLTDPDLPELIVDWELEIERLTRQFRAHATAHPSEFLDQLTRELRASHPRFEDAWTRHDVAPLAPKERVLRTPDGERVFEQHRLTLPDHEGWLLVVFLP